jgi:ribonucleoside-diphosphate reductase alpha chain
MPKKTNHKTHPAGEGTLSRTGARRKKEAGLEGGLRFERRFTRAGVDPFSEVEWETRDAVIANERGETVFEQRNVEIPAFWSMTATNVVVSKYFRGNLGTPERERSVRQLLGRVVDTITRWGDEGGYFASDEDRDAFHDELKHLVLHQKMAFNSPVWFNVGVVEKPQCSACFINSVQDSMESILDLAKTEGMLFKWGSGTGSNLSKIRSSRESLAGGGTASGPVSFMRGYDAFAGVIKSGGKTRRAAKMVILDVEHPDIMDFIRCKEVEEKKAWALIEAGYDGGFNVPGGAYDSIFYQNANHSVRVTDDFMRAVEEDAEWTTRSVTAGEPMGTFKARELLRTAAEATYVCGDPGLQFDTTINRWHTCKNTDRIYASNPCSEYMFLNDTACNLASLNLKRFQTDDGRFDVASFTHAVDVTITAMEIVVDTASYPTPRIAENSHAYRPLGLGYANLGALLMSWGVPYDSDQGRAVAGAITGLMCGQAYATSARIAAQIGPFEGYAVNEAPMLEVVDMHREAVEAIDPAPVPEDLLAAARESWRRARTLGGEYGFRNSQVTVLAPTGTIGFLMDCDTTGVEPELALVKYKKLVGGGLIKIVNQSVEPALERLGYAPADRKRIVDFIEEKGTIEGAPGLDERHLPVFDCSFTPVEGTRSINYRGHLRMMAAVQPFLSGAISKTINMPTDVSVEDIEAAYLEAWKLGLKAVALYRDGSKRTQPLSTRKDDGRVSAVSGDARRPYRRRLPDERQSITHKFSIGGHEGYITVGMYEDGTPGEIFVVMSKEGSVVSGLMDGFATAISLALQYGVPLRVLISKFSHTRFEPSGFTGNREIPIAKSILDYIARWLASRFLSESDQEKVGINRPESEDETAGPLASGVHDAALGEPAPGPKPGVGVNREDTVAFRLQEDAPPCHECGAIMVRGGACYKCLNCGATSGCS